MSCFPPPAAGLVPGAAWPRTGLPRGRAAITQTGMKLRYHTPLTAEEQIAHGLADPQPLALADRVRFSELDNQNHVNNKAYHEWFEVARTEYLRRLCIPCYGDQPAPRIALRSATIRYVKEMLAGEDYIATARVSAFRTTSYTVEQQIWSGDLRATLSAVVVTLRPDGSGDRYPLPKALLDRFVTQDGARRDA